jgi:hypothetical protein
MEKSENYKFLFLSSTLSHIREVHYSEMREMNTYRVRIKFHLCGSFYY